MSHYCFLFVERLGKDDGEKGKRMIKQSVVFVSILCAGLKR